MGTDNIYGLSAASQICQVPAVSGRVCALSRLYPPDEVAGWRHKRLRRRMQPNRTYPIPLTWQQWQCLGHQNTYTDFQTYMRNIVGELAGLFLHTGPSAADTTTVENLRQAFVTLSAGSGAVVPAGGNPPPVPMVAAATALLDGLLTAIANNLIDDASTENAQAKWSPLNRMVIRQLTDADLILASSNGAVGWQAAWANQPIPVSIMHPVMIQEIRVLCAFILCSDTVVGAVIRDDERGTVPAAGGPPRWAATGGPPTRRTTRGNSTSIRASRCRSSTSPQTSSRTATRCGRASPSSTCCSAPTAG